MDFVLDASLALSWAFEDERDERSLAILDLLLDSEAVTSSIWPLEVANGLLAAERRGRITSEESNRFSALLLHLPIVVDPVERRRPFEVVRQSARTNGLTSYDASYLEVATRLGIPIATLDRELALAAEEMGVETLPRLGVSI